MAHLSQSARRFEDVATEAAVARASSLMEAMVAAYALMAHADGEVSGAERRRIFSILRDNPVMTVFSRAELAEEIAAHEANYRYDPELAQQIAREKLAPIAGDRRAAHKVVQACRELIPADGVAHPAEYRALAGIKVVLDFDDRPASAAADDRSRSLS